MPSNIQENYNDDNDKVILQKVAEKYQEIMDCEKENIYLLFSSSQTDTGKQKKIIILDWDDTILPTFFLQVVHNLDHDSVIPIELEKELEKFEKIVYEFLVNMLLKFSKVYIVTNAEQNWVQLSCMRYMPGVLPMLNNKNIKIRSAQFLFGKMYPGQHKLWKKHTIKSILVEDEDILDTDGQVSVISIGDSLFEREACIELCKEYNEIKKVCNILCKTVKFIERPDMEVLGSQLKTVIDILNEICDYGDDIDSQLNINVYNI